jgi:hypothetical protein
MGLNGLGYKRCYKGVDKEKSKNVSLSVILKFTLVWIGSLQLKNILKQESLSNRRSARYV